MFSFRQTVIWPVDIVYDKDSDDAKSNYIKDDVSAFLILSYDEKNWNST